MRTRSYRAGWPVEAHPGALANALRRYRRRRVVEIQCIRQCCRSFDVKAASNINAVIHNKMTADQIGL